VRVRLVNLCLMAGYGVAGMMQPSQYCLATLQQHSSGAAFSYAQAAFGRKASSLSCGCLVNGLYMVHVCVLVCMCLSAGVMVCRQNMYLPSCWRKGAQAERPWFWDIGRACHQCECMGLSMLAARHSGAQPVQNPLYGFLVAHTHGPWST
jgi:hypothetical protein